MNDKEKKQPNKLIERLKNIKHIEIYIAIIFIVVIFLIYLSSTKQSNANSSNTTKDSSISAYIENLENNLEKSLSNIAGVSKVHVMITLDTSTIEVTDSKINMSKFPKIKGVLITAKGVDSTLNKMKVLHAVETVIEIEQGRIEILSSE